MDVHAQGEAPYTYYALIRQFTQMTRNTRNILFSTCAPGQNERQLLAAKIGNMQLYIIGGSCYLKVQKKAQKNGRFAGAQRWRENLLLFTIGAPLKFSPQVQLPYPRKVGRFKPFIAPTYATSPPSTLRFCQVLSLKVGALRYSNGQ